MGVYVFTGTGSFKVLYIQLKYTLHNFVAFKHTKYR